jgi:hypothetical protein
MTTYAGIDPGLDGGLAILHPERALTLAIMPTRTAGAGGRRVVDQVALDAWLMDLPPDTFLVIEAQSAMRGYGVSSAFSLGLTYGAITQALVSRAVRHQRVKPQVWQREYGIAGHHQRTKAQALVVAQGLWPMQDWRATDRCRTAHDGLVDAALMAEFARRLDAGRLAA